MSFLPADVDERLFSVDIAFPFRLTAEGDLDTVAGEDNVMQALPIRATTTLGEIPVFPDDGLDLDDLEGVPATEAERAVIKARTLAQFRRDDRLQSLTVETEDGPAGPTDTLVHLRAELRNGKTVPATVAFGDS